jgi:hypothetical protein
MPNLVQGIRDFAALRLRRGWPGHRRLKEPPFFERLCPAHDELRDCPAHFIVGMTNSAPSFVPFGQRDVTVFVFV